MGDTVARSFHSGDMKLKLPAGPGALLRATSLWRENHLILREFQHCRWVVVAAIAFALTGAFFEGLTVGFVASFLQGLTSPNEPPIQIGVDWFDRVFLASEAAPEQRLYQLSGLLLVAVWLRAGFDYLSEVYAKKASLSLVEQLRYRIFEQLVSLQLSFYTTNSPGSLVNVARGETNQVNQTFNTLSILIVHGSKVLAYLASMLLLSWQLCLLSAAVFGLMSVGLTALTTRVKRASFAVPQANKAFTANTLSFVNGIRAVHASGTQAFERRRYYAAAHQIHDAALGVIRLAALVRPAVEGLGATLLVCLVVVSYRLLITTGDLNAAELLTFLFVLTRVTPLVSSLNGARVSFISAQGSLSTVSDLLKREDKPYFQDGTIEFTHLQQSIEFEAVNFAYQPDEPVLQDITLSIKRGETTALVGASGAGKTTLADLIPRFYDPTRGRVLVDGVDLRDLKINSLRAKMAIVSQDTFIFDATVRENILYGVEAASDDAIFEAAHRANALAFIQELPQGFETILGDRGVRLSGGQRQRVAIARALLRDPEILILDEATSALDSLTERLIQESLDRLVKGRTVVAIAHRLSTITGADKVVVLEQGRIVEEGSYQQLLETRGKLWQYHQSQFELSGVS